MAGQNISKTDPKTREILSLLAAGVLLTASLFMPGAAVVAGAIAKAQSRAEWKNSQKEWEKFNLHRLRQVIKRMQQVKYIEISEVADLPAISITEKGKKKLLQFKVEDMKLDEKTWDGKWRLIIYDVVVAKRTQAEQFRRALLRLRILKLQKSVYLTPFKCEEEIEYLRQFYGIGDEVIILTAGNLENESAYRHYFGI